MSDSPAEKTTFRVGLRGAWEVRAGVIPEQAMPEYTRQFFYTTPQYEEDKARPQSEMTTFRNLADEAQRYALGLMNPAFVNWVETVWIWY